MPRANVCVCSWVVVRKPSRWPLEGVIPLEDWKDRCGVARHEARLLLGDGMG